MSPAVTSTFAIPGEPGRICPETEACRFVTNFSPADEVSTVPAARLIADPLPFAIWTLPVALFPINFVPVVDFVLSPETLSVII